MDKEDVVKNATTELVGKTEELDCISREDAKNLFWDGTEGYDCRGFTRMEIGEMLDDLPSVNPQEPKTGHWIFKQFDKETGISNSHWCSECGKPLAQVYKTYCSNCGCRMESEE